MESKRSQSVLGEKQKGCIVYDLGMFGRDMDHIKHSYQELHNGSSYSFSVSL